MTTYEVTMALMWVLLAVFIITAIYQLFFKKGD